MRTIQSCIFTADKNIQKVFKKQFKFVLITIIFKKIVLLCFEEIHTALIDQANNRRKLYLLIQLNLIIFLKCLY
jgi:hypothetical protein